MSDSAIALLLEYGLLRPSFVSPPEIQQLRMLTAGPDRHDADNWLRIRIIVLRIRIIERHLPVTTRPTSVQDWQTQPLTMAPSRVAEQNRAAIASWLAGLCGQTTHASPFVASSAFSSNAVGSRSRTSAEVVMGKQSVDDVMAERA